MKQSSRAFFSAVLTLVFLASLASGCSRKDNSLRKSLEAQLARQSFDAAAFAVEETKKFPLAVASARPDGKDLKAISQIAVTFNKPMVPLTDFEQAASNVKINVIPAVVCTWHWINRFTVACDLEKPLPGSTAFSVSVNPGAKAFDGTTLANRFDARFETERWKLIHDDTEWPKPDLPVFTLTFNQPMQLESLRTNLKSTCGTFQLERITTKKAGELLLDASRTYIATAQAPLGLDKNCELQVQSSAQSGEGPLPGTVFKTSYHTYPEFRLTNLHCGYEPTKGTKPYKEVGDRFEITCDPDKSFSFDFTAPVLSKQLVGAIDVEPFFGWIPWGIGSPEMLRANGDDELMSFTLFSPMKGRSLHRIEIKKIHDRWGRELAGINKVLITTKDFFPMFRVDNSFGVVEKKYPARVGINSVNVGAFELAYQTSTKIEDTQKLFRRFTGSYAECEAIKKGVVDDQGLTKKRIVTKGELNLTLSFGLDLKTAAPEFETGIMLGRVTHPETLQNMNSGSIDACEHFFMVKTDLGITAKLGFYDGGVWIHSIESAQPQAGVQVTLWDGLKALGQGTTDAEGFVKMPGANQWDPERQRAGNQNELFVVAQTSQDFSVLPFSRGQEGLQPYYFSNYESGIYLSGNPLRASENHIVQAITDRPLYQPRQDVNLKVFARHWEPRTFGLKPDSKVTISVQDPQGNSIFSKELTLNDFGTANATFNLGATAGLGSYYIQATVGKWSAGIGSFEVQEFQLLPFKIETENLRPFYQVGQSAAFRVKASYHFGGAVADKTGHYSLVYQEGVYAPKSATWSRFDFSNSYSLEIPGYQVERGMERNILGEGTLKTGKDGIAVPEVVLSPNGIRKFGQINFEATLADDRGRSIAGSTSANVWFGDYQLGLRKKAWTYEVKNKIEVEAVALNVFEEAVKGAPIKLQLVQRSFQNVRMKGSGNYFYYNTRTKDEIVDTCEVRSATKEVSCGLQPKKPGVHYVVAQIADSKKRVSKASMYVYVTGPGFIGWERNNNDQIELVPEKKTYEVGETAKVLIKNPYPEVDALITLERFGILKQWKKKLLQGAEILEIPLTEKDYAPGFNVSVMLLKGRVSEEIKAGVDLGRPSFKMGLTKLEVIDPGTRLKVVSNVDRPQYEPSDKVKLDLNIDAPAGHQIEELSVAVVDEKILQLSGAYQDSYDLHKKFYDFGYGDVMTSEMLSHLIGRRVFGKKGAVAGGDGDLARHRKNFLPIAYWNPELKTDSSGKASVEFKLPDNLTTWRVLVVAADKSHRFGFGSSTFVVSKKLMIEPALPSFLTEGDEFSARFTVFNRTGKSSDVSTGLKIEYLELSKNSKSLVVLKVADQQSGIFDFGLKVPFGVNIAKLAVSAASGTEKDGAEFALPIVPFVSYDTFGVYESTEKSALTLPVKLPTDYRPELSRVDLAFSSSLIQQLDDVFTYALKYPYSCWEQTLFRASMLNYYQQLKAYIPNYSLGRDPEPWIKELLMEMPKFQAPNGGMGYWKSDSDTADPYLSAHTALALTWLSETGINAPAESQTKLLTYLDGLLRGKIEYPRYYSDDMKRTVRVSIVYSLLLNKKDVTSYLTALFTERDKLDLFSKSFLYEAAYLKPETQELAGKLEKEILATAQETPARIIFQDKIEDGYKRLLYSENRTQCRLLEAFVRHNPKLPIIQPLLRSALAFRKQGAWLNTQENLFCSQALLTYAKVFEKSAPNFEIKANVFGKDLAPAKFKTYQDSYVPAAIELADKKLGSTTDIKVSKSGPGRIYVAARLRLARSAEFTRSRAAGLDLAREYFLLSADKKTWRPLAEPFKVRRGDVIKILLKVKTPATRYQVALRDALPAGFEPLNEALAGTQKIVAKGPSTTSQPGDAEDNGDDSGEGDWRSLYWGGGFYYREMKLQGGHFFADSLSAGTYSVEYTAQAIATGTFNVGPAIVEEMYEPEVYGHTKTAQFGITE